MAQSPRKKSAAQRKRESNVRAVKSAQKSAKQSASQPPAAPASPIDPRTPPTASQFKKAMSGFRPLTWGDAQARASIAQTSEQATSFLKVVGPRSQGKASRSRRGRKPGRVTEVEDVGQWPDEMVQAAIAELGAPQGISSASPSTTGDPMERIIQLLEQLPERIAEALEVHS